MRILDRSVCATCYVCSVSIIDEHNVFACELVRVFIDEQNMTISKTLENARAQVIFTSSEPAAIAFSGLFPYERIPGGFFRIKTVIPVGS